MNRTTVLMGSLLIILSVCTFADFTIGVIPDTQNLVHNDNDAAKLTAMTQFFADRKEELNMVFVSSLGDMSSDGGSGSSQWVRVRAAYDVLIAAGIPFAPCQGNHDELAPLNETFPYTELKETSNLVEALNNRIENAVYLFTADGMEFMLQVQEDTPKPASREWCAQMYNKYPERRAIHVNHNIQEVAGDWVVATIVTQHDNIFMAVAGHDCASDGEVRWTTTSPSGHTQNILRTDYQCRGNGGAIVRYYTFKPGEDKVCAFTYNVTEKAYERDDGSEFCFDYDMETTTSIAEYQMERDGSGYVIIPGRLDLASYGGAREIAVYDMAGGRRFYQELAPGQVSVSFGDLEQGRYIVRLSTAGGTVSQPAMLLR